MARRPRAGAHDALLDAARDEFARSGLERARVEDVARRAGISKGAFYLHFRTKDDAFREIVQRFLGALEDHARRRHEVEDRILRESPTGRALAIGDLFEAECAIDVDLLELLWRNRQIVSAVDGASRKIYRECLADFRRRMRSLVARRSLDRQRAASLRADVDPEVIGDTMRSIPGLTDIQLNRADPWRPAAARRVDPPVRRARRRAAAAEAPGASGDGGAGIAARDADSRTG